MPNNNFLPGDFARMTFAGAARQAHRNGYDVLPVHPGSKVPAIKMWQKPASSARLGSSIQQFPDFNVGFLCGTCVAFDNDADDPDQADKLHGLVLDIFGGDPPERWRGPTRRLFLYRAWLTAETSHYNGFDIIGQKGQFVGFGTHKDGSSYRWKNGSPLDRKLSDLPVATPEGLEALQEQLDKLIGKRRPSKRTKVKQSDTAIRVPQATTDSLINDGRDEVLSSCVWHVWATGEHDPNRIAQLAFALFTSRVAMTRPKRDGTDLWSLTDAFEKAVYLLSSGKTRPKPGHLASPTGKATEPVFDVVGFNTAVSEIGSLGDLSRAAVRISRVMAGLAAQSGVCFAAAKTLAKWLDLNEDTVTKQRSRLVTMGLWTRAYDFSKASGMAEFRPQVAFTIDEAKRVVADATHISSWRDDGEDEAFGTYEEQIQNNSAGFEFRELGGSLGEDLP